MQRTYGRRALRRQQSKNHQYTPEGDPSPPQKRPKVYVEIVSPRKLKPVPTQTDFSTSDVGTTPSRPGSNPVSFHSRSPTRESVVKRMLTRSRTESSLEAMPTTKVSQIKSSTFQTLPTSFPERDATPEAPSQSSPKLLPTRNTRTYAGSSRSFLVALPAPDADPLNTVGNDTEPHESYADLRTRWGIDLSEDDPQPQEHASTAVSLKRNPSDFSLPFLSTMTNDLKSITELRSKGESRRFLDEVGYLFEGLDSSSAIGLKRASAFEVVSKLCDVDFNRRAKTSDFYARTWEKFRAARAGANDKIFDATITFFTALAARDPPTLAEVAQHEELLSTLFEILSYLDNEKDVLGSALARNSDEDLKSYGVLRTEIAALRSLAGLASKESSLSSVKQPSARFFVTHSLAILPPSLLAEQYLPTLLVNMRTELGLLEPRIAAYESGLPVLPPTGTSQRDIPSFCHIEACLRLLDSYLLGRWSSASPDCKPISSELSHMDGFTSELISLCIVSSGLLESGEEIDTARKCLCNAMRVLTLLSHDDSWWCGAALEVSHALSFVTMTAMKSQARWSESWNAESPNSSVESFDLLCLALGLVMNWASLNPKTAALSRMKSINPACSSSRLCVRACQCPNQKSLLECFTTLHAQYSDTNREDDPPECAFLKGYTAILLGLLIKDDPFNQAIVEPKLPGSSPSDKIKSLINHCHSFLDLYNDTIPLPSSPSDSIRASPEVTTHEVTGRHKVTWDKRGGDIARSVIASLERLCNT